jgi:protein O-mannosyl-transferase
MDKEDTSAHDPEAADSAPESEPQPASAPAPESSGLPTPWRWAIGLLIVALLAYPNLRRMIGGSDGTSVVGGQNLLNVSLEQYQAGRYEESIKTAQEVLKTSPNSAPAYNNMAVAYLALKRYDEAIQSAEQALRANPDFQLAKNNLAWIRQEQANNGSAKSAPPPPGSPEYFVNQSLADYQAGRYRECIEAARQALKLRPDYAEAYNNIAAAQASMGQYNEAIKNALAALKINPDFQLARNNLAWAEGEQAKLNAGAKK